MRVRRLLLGGVLLALGATSAGAAPGEAVHALDWRVHVDLLDPGAGRDLAFFEHLIADSLAESNVLLVGHQGPADAGCCATLAALTVSSFGTPGDGLDVITDAGELSAVFAFGPGFALVQSVFYCGGSTSTGIRGCSPLGGDRSAVALDAEESGFLPAVIAHERGHSAGLVHVSANPCQLMAASNGGGCLSVSECQSLIADATTGGGSCECLADTLGDAPEPLGSVCSDASGCGICSGGVCGACTSLAGAALVAAGGTGSASGSPPVDAIVQAGASGDWEVLGALGGEIGGLAYDPQADVLYGVESRAGDDALVTVDPATGAIGATLGVLTGREQVIALAWDPQPAGGRLLAIEVDDDFFGQTCLGALGIAPPCFSDLFGVDPDTLAQTPLGELNALILTGGVQALAWAETLGTLYGATPAGLARIDLGSCNGSTCPGTSAVDDVFRNPVSLAWDPATGLLVREGDDGFGGHGMDVIDPATGVRLASRGLDAWSAGGLAVTPVPEAHGVLGLALCTLGLAVLSARRPRRA